MLSLNVPFTNKTDDVVASDYGTTVTFGSGLTLAFMQSFANTTQFLGNIFITDTFCTSVTIANKSDALMQAFSNIREIHGFLQVLMLDYTRTSPSLSPSLSLSLSLSLSHTHTHTHTLSLSLSLSLSHSLSFTHTHTLSLILSLSRIHTLSLLPLVSFSLSLLIKL